MNGVTGGYIEKNQQRTTRITALRQKEEEKREPMPL